MQEPKLLILDEPTSVLTPSEAESLFKTLDVLKGEGTGILFISHKLEEVRRLCSRATILRGGKRVASADPTKNLGARTCGADGGRGRRRYPPRLSPSRAARRCSPAKG